MIALFLVIVAGAAYLARDRWVWEGDPQGDLIQANGRIECDHVTIAGKLLSLAQDLLARD